MDRRGFLGSILAIGVAPAIVRADSLMRVIPIEAAIVEVDLSEFAGLSLSQIITETLRRRAPEIAENVRRNNQLLMRLKETRFPRGLIQ